MTMRIVEGKLIRIFSKLNRTQCEDRIDKEESNIQIVFNPSVEMIDEKMLDIFRKKKNWLDKKFYEK